MATVLKNLSDFSSVTIPQGVELRIGIVVAEWNEQITNALYEGAVNTLLKQQVAQQNIEVIQVPGSYELVHGAQVLAEKKHFDAIICLGCVIQGETPHFDFICDAVAHGLINLTLKYNRPFVFGVLTTNTLEQAIARSGGKHGNKGDEAAVTAIKMACLTK